MSTVPVFTELQVRPLGPVRRFFVRRPRAMDGVLVFCFAVWSLITGIGADSMYLLSDRLDGEQVLQMQSVSLALTVLGSVALVWRRRWPVAVTAIMTGLGVVALAATGAASGFEVGVAIGLYTVAVQRHAFVAWITGAVAVAVLFVGVRVFPLVNTVGAIMRGNEPNDPGVLTSDWYESALPFIVLALLAVAFGTSVRNSRLHIARFVDAANAVAREDEARTRLVQAAERARIAREMHDVVAHSLTVMVALGGGASVSIDRAPERAREALDELVDTGRAALGDMRRVLGVLDEQDAQGGAPTEPSPGGHDLPALVDRFRMAGLSVRATGLTCVDETDAALQLAVYRIVQEALTNVLRHAPGTRSVELDIRADADAVEVVVTDHGATAHIEPGSGSQRGLIGMRERAAVFGGTVQAGPHGDGWRVRVELPR